MSIYNSSIAYVNLDATKSHVIHSNSKVPFFFGNLVDYSSLESSLVKQHKDICAFFIKNYEPKLKLPSVSILENQNQILKFVPDKSRPYLKSVLSCFNIEFEISTHRKTIAGSCCFNKKLGYAKISIIGYLNKYKCLTIILHELAHAINSFSKTAHDNSWKLVYSFLLMNFYRFYPEKYKRELLWGILYTPATLKLSNFYSKGVLFGSFADDPKKIIERQIIDLTSKKYSSFKDMICDYAIAIKFEFEIKENLLEVLEREEVSNFLFSCVKEMSLRAILASIEDTRINVQDIEQVIEKSFSEFPNKNNISLKLKMISDVVVFCWSKYCSLDRDQVNCFLENVQSPNFFYKAIAQLALLK